MEFRSWKINFRNEVCLKNSRSSDHLCTGSKKLRLPRSIDEPVTSRLIVGRTPFPWFRYGLMRWLRLHWKNFSTCRYISEREESVKEQRAQKHDRFLRGRQLVYSDLRAFLYNRSLWSSTRTLRLVLDKFAEWRRPRFRLSDGIHALLSVSEMPSDVILEGLYKSKPQRLRSVSDCVGCVRSKKLFYTHGQTKLLTIEECL